MSRFVRLTVSDFIRLVGKFEWKRKIRAVHVHHTWHPNHTEWRGLKSIENMWHYHTQTNGWSDIAQHITIDPEGFVWTGRNWNQPPASAKGFNGSISAGPFMFETVGDFDLGHDPFGGAQKETVLRVTASLLDHFDLGIEAVRFHNEMSSKSCPGTGIDRLNFLSDVKAHRTSSGARGVHARADADEPTYDSQSLDALKQVIESGPPTQDYEDGEPDDSPAVMPEYVAPYSESKPRGELSASDREKLRRHVINSRDGRLSSGGAFTTSREDVQRIFAEHIPNFARTLEADEPLRLALYAHGGLNSEQSGLQVALTQVDWWLVNKVYPLFFVWETGFLETLGQILSHSRNIVAGARGGADLSDHFIECFSHHLGGVGIWSQMKLSAARGVDPVGASTITVEALHEFLDKAREQTVELHAVGHSAGAIFHSWLVPAVTAHPKATFKTLSLLAPAIRVDDFVLRLLPQMIDQKVEKTTIFTMTKDLELADTVGSIYRKSLLYLIYHALEPDEDTPILGLDECLHADPKLREAFGLMGLRPASGGSVVWSKTKATSGPDASTSTSHGGFDNDVPTMNSVIRRVLALDREPLEKDFPTGTRAVSTLVLRDPIEYLPQPFRTRFAASFWSGQSGGSVTGPSAAVSVPGAPAIFATKSQGRRRALCIGINAYPTAPLAGAVSDARLWAAKLEQLGFTTPLLLLDADACRERILNELERLICASATGDQIVFQYSGHGTQLDDTDADEDDALDEAICPVDFDDGAFIIDDDFAQVFARIPDGVALTCFFDCCHSGENTRLAVGRPRAGGSGARPRFIRATPRMQEQHQAFRARFSRRGFARSGDRRQMRQVVFSACRSDEVAWETGGQGDFTRIALPLLAGSVGLPHRKFVEAVINAFGSVRRQTPELDCADVMRDQPLLGGTIGTGTAASTGELSCVGRASIGRGDGTEAWARVAEAIAAALRS